MKKLFSKNTFILELLLYFWVFYFFYSVKFNPQYYEEKLFLYLLIQFIVWFLISWFTHSFKQFRFNKNYFKTLSPFINSYFFFLLITIPSLYLFSFSPYVAKRIYFSSTIYVLWSFVIQSFRYFSFKPQKTDEVNIKFLKATTYPEIEELSFPISTKNFVFNNFESETSKQFYSDELSKKLKKSYLAECPDLFNFISLNINLEKFDITKSVIIRSSDPYNIKVLPNNSIEFFVNLHELNDIRRINEYFIILNQKLSNGGVYIGKFEPTRFRYRRYLKNYPNGLAQVFYFYDFFWKRVIPKLPFIKRFYFAVTRGKDRALSLAEGLGRLYYSGFEVLNLFEQGNFITFIAKKTKAPSKDKNPSYSPMFKMRRVGKNGEDIFVYKLRTMHPYSEYLQTYMINKFGMENGDKINKDFRITYWGAFLRKLWIDELPMLINLFKGDIKLVGVRPLSKAKFEIYDSNIKKMRTEFKPGLIPPFYADLPNNFDELMESEKNYLLQYKRAPIKTDAKYFFKAWYNILIKKARSG